MEALAKELVRRVKVKNCESLQETKTVISQSFGKPFAFFLCLTGTNFTLVLDVEAGL